MFAECFENVRSTCPLIHNITNYVTVNDCANMVLAAGPPPSWPTMPPRWRTSPPSAAA